MSTPTEAERLAQQMLAGLNPEEQRALLDRLLGTGAVSIIETLKAPEPAVGPAPAEVSGFRVRLDLRGTKPPVWRRLELRGDLTLPRLHDVIQAAMGWTDSHLHQFRTGSGPRSAYFITTFDLEEGEDGVLEDDVRLDQLVVHQGDRLGYEYDFGDGWDHQLTVERVLAEPPAHARCTGGRGACPPEDCGGIGGYHALAAWVRSGYDDALLPRVFDDSAQAHDWLPDDWRPDHFDLEEANAALSVAVAEPVAVAGELAELVAQLERQGIMTLRHVLGRPQSHGPTDVTQVEAERLTSTYRELLDVVGDGVTLTSAGYLPPTVVASFAERSGISQWWFGKANREDVTPPVRNARESARALGLVAVRKGRLTPTTVGRRCRQDPHALWQHIVSRLPLGRNSFEREAGWLTLAVAGSGAPAEEWSSEIGDLLYGLGWGTAEDAYSTPPTFSPTLAVLQELAGAARTGFRITGADPAVATTARAAIRT